MEQSSLVVGIDLGTTNSLIGTVIDGRAKVFGDEVGRALMPSVVGVAPGGGVIVGRAARNRRLIDPDGTAVSVKRLMGSQASVRVGTRSLSPPQVSALILGALLDRAEKELGARPHRVVITVPAYFDDTQREATRTAGELAGAKVERLVNEPTAAAVYYQTGGEARVLVYDFGGGTFDVSVLDRDEGFLEVKASRGDTHLGGDDIDRALCDRVLERLGEARSRIQAEKPAMTRLLEAVERAKIGLSEREEYHLGEPFLAGEGEGAVHLDLVLSRADVEAAARPFVERTLRCIDEALRDARLAPHELDRVLLVGGTSKMPLVANMVSQHLRRPVVVDAQADRAVGLGAALLAGRASGANVDEVLVDITPHTLAVGALRDSESFPGDQEELDAIPVIPRDTAVPVQRKRTLFTMIDDQMAVELPVVQGEGTRVGDNTWLGLVHIADLPPAPAHSPVEVTFQLDLSGVLQVTALHLSSGKAATVTFAESPYRLTELARVEAKSVVDALRATATEPEATPATSLPDTSLATAMIARARRVLGRGGAQDAAALARVRESTERLEEAIMAGATSVSGLTDALSDALLDVT